MNRRELAVAPRAGVVASAVLALIPAVLFAVVTRGGPLPLRIAGVVGFGLFVFVYGFLVSYVYGDAKRRGMRHRVWTLVAALVPNGLGFLAYFLLREPVLRRCGACGAAARRDLAFCPQCGSPLAGACPACRRPVEAHWSHCAHCGTTLTEGAPAPPR
jgi:RNA polymerase subunit RPABC4/transcription elongation factor Spt4